MIARYNAVQTNYQQGLCMQVNMRIVNSSSDSPLYIYVNVSSEEEAKQLQNDMQAVVLGEFKEKFDKIVQLKEQSKALELQASELLQHIKRQTPIFMRNNYPELIL